MKKILSILSLICTLQGVAQINLDSLWTVWADGNRPDTIRLQAMQRICLQGYLYSNPDTAIILAKEMQDFAELKNEKHYQVFALQVQGTACSIQGDNIKGIDYFTKALKIAEETQNLKDMTTSINNIGVIYYEQGNNKKAMEYYLRSLEIAEKMKRKKSIAFALGNLGNVYKNLGQMDKAIESQTRCLQLAEEVKDEESKANALHSLAVIYSDLYQDEKALDYDTRALAIHTAADDQNAMAQSMIIIGLSYSRLNQAAKGIEILEKSLAIGQKGGFVTSIRESSYHLYMVYKAQNKTTDALAMHELYIEMRDSIKNEEGQQAVMQQEMQYNYDKQKALDEKERKVELSVKKLEEKQTKETIKKYKNVDSGASLADILGPAMLSEKKPKKSKKDKKEE